MSQKVIIMTFGNMYQAKEVTNLNKEVILQKFAHPEGWHILQKVIIMTFGDMRQA